MNPENERMENFLKGVVLPDCNPEEHGRQLRSQIISEVEVRRAGRARRGARWRMAAIGLGLLCVGAAATETIIQAHRFSFQGKISDGTYLFSSTNNGVMIATDGTGGIEGKRQELEELDLLKQRNARELVGVTDTEVNGKLSNRSLLFKYVLSDGRTKIFPETPDSVLEQIADLRRHGQRDLWRVNQTDFDGVSERLLWFRYTLKDGEQTCFCETDPAMRGPVHLTTVQRFELARLAGYKQGELVGRFQAEVSGTTFEFKKYSYKLPDGTVVTQSEGQRMGAPKIFLTAADWQELHRMEAARKGESIGDYNQKVLGKTFKFTRVKYVLNDGTEVVWSKGKPAGEQ